MRWVGPLGWGAAACYAHALRSAHHSHPTLSLHYPLLTSPRSTLLVHRWAESMAAQGSGGAFEISQRMTAMVGKQGPTRPSLLKSFSCQRSVLCLWVACGNGDEGVT